MNYPKTIQDLIESFTKLPSIGKKTAERLAIYVYSQMNIELVNEFADHLKAVKSNLYKCSICGNLSEQQICDICNDKKRNQGIIMVVENVKDLFILERLEQFSGVYHVLNGAINFASGIGVEDIDIASLVKRVKDGNIKEIILATNATLEGETTARYIKALLEEENVAITRIAHGIPVGGDLQYTDEITVLKALEGRRKY